MKARITSLVIIACGFLIPQSLVFGQIKVDFDKGMTIKSKENESRGSGTNRGDKGGPEGDRKPNTSTPPPPSDPPKDARPIPTTENHFVRSRPMVFGGGSMSHLRQIEKIFLSSAALAHIWTYSSLSNLNTKKPGELGINVIFSVKWNEISTLLTGIENAKRGKMKEEITEALFDIENKILERNVHGEDTTVEYQERRFWKYFDQSVPDPVSTKY